MIIPLNLVTQRHISHITLSHPPPSVTSGDADDQARPPCVTSQRTVTKEVDHERSPADDLRPPGRDLRGAAPPSGADLAPAAPTPRQGADCGPAGRAGPAKPVMTCRPAAKPQVSALHSDAARYARREDRAKPCPRCVPGPQAPLGFAGRGLPAGSPRLRRGDAAWAARLAASGQGWTCGPSHAKRY